MYIIPDKDPREGKLKLSFPNYYPSKKTCLSEEWLNELSDAFRAWCCLLYTSPSPRDRTRSRMPSSA